MSQQRLIESLSGLFATDAVVFWHDVEGALDLDQKMFAALTRSDQTKLFAPSDTATLGGSLPHP